MQHLGLLARQHVFRPIQRLVTPPRQRTIRPLSPSPTYPPHLFSSPLNVPNTPPPPPPSHAIVPPRCVHRCALSLSLPVVIPSLTPHYIHHLRLHSSRVCALHHPSSFARLLPLPLLIPQSLQPQLIFPLLLAHPSYLPHRPPHPPLRRHHLSHAVSPLLYLVYTLEIPHILTSALINVVLMVPSHFLLDCLPRVDTYYHIPSPCVHVRYRHNLICRLLQLELNRNRVQFVTSVA